MSLNEQAIIPAARTIKQFDKLLRSDFEYVVVLEVNIGQLRSLKQEATRHGKKLIIHADLIHGLKTDNFGADYLCNDIRPAAIISTRSNIIMKAKSRGIIAIQRIFLIDSIALEKSYSLLEQTQPDYIELLPGVIPEMIQEVYDKIQIPIITGGLIRTIDEAQQALKSGAIAITTSNVELWVNLK